MDERAHDEILGKLPRAPYPGLRPFLDHEEMLMFGRESQLAEIVERLRASRFVAIIGGSGSGKSSLVRAGVVPHLRSYGIPEVGDLWLPIVFTPGTNAMRGGVGTAGQTPLTRLADRFERCLLGTRDAGRRADIVALLRRPAGLTRVVESFVQDFDLPAGVRSGSARVLFVIDQFEELFDRSNQDVADARHLVERVIDHFHTSRNAGSQGRPGCCFVVLTMRSEHLSDCAAFLGLPEAINAGTFLVSRLDEPQLRQVIVRPAQRFLRLRRRLEPDSAVLPAAVEFDEAIVERLLRDTAAIAHDPDHLPLLQHVLARAWDAACRREALGHDGVPARMSLADLREAATAGRVGLDEQSQGPGLLQRARRGPDNVLRASLENWAERIFAGYDRAGQAELEDVLRRLAFRDPMTGTYSRRRIDATRYGERALWRLVKDGFVGHVNYLFWDDEDPDHVTLKVSHESFIRGWSRFRRLVDDEAARFARFVHTVQEHDDWLRSGRQDEWLLTPRELRRVREAGVFEALAQPDRLQDWLQMLKHLPGGEPVEPDRAGLAAFLHASGRHERMVRTRRLTRRWLAIVAFFSAPVIAYAVFVQAPVGQRAQRYFEAAELANAATNSERHDSVGAGAPALSSLVAAAASLRAGQTGEDMLLGRAPGILLGHWPLSRLKVADLLPAASRSIEPVLNEKLRAALAHAVWRAGRAGPADPGGVSIDDRPDPPARLSCNGQPGILLPVEGRRENDPVRRGLFLTDAPYGTELGEGNRLLFSATLRELAPTSAAGDARPASTAAGEGRVFQCRLGRQLLALSVDRNPAVLFDATLRYMFLAADGEPGQTPTVSVHRLHWGDPGLGDCASIDFPLVVLADARVVEAVREQARLSLGEAAATWHMPGGRGVRVDGNDWWLVSGSASRLTPSPRDDELAPLAPLPGGDACERTQATAAGDVAARGMVHFDTDVHRSGNYCLAISRGVPPDLAGATMASTSCGARSSGRDQVVVDVYFRPRAHPRERARRPTRVAGFEFGRLDPSELDWHVGTPGSRYEGWLVLRRRDARGTRYFGAPWSTGALMRLGEQVLAAQREAGGH